MRKKRAQSMAYAKLPEIIKELIDSYIGIDISRYDSGYEYCCEYECYNRGPDCSTGCEDYYIALNEWERRYDYEFDDISYETESGESCD
jgi:hypothetical protein